MNKLKGLIATVMLMSISTFAQSIQLNQVYSLDSQSARTLLDAAVVACQKIQRNIAVVVVDRGGNTLMANRHETVGPHNLGAAEKKAYTALSTKMETLLLSQNVHENKDAKNLTTLSNLLLLGGGIPVRYKNQVVGAIGVAGAGGAKNDHYCAETAVQSIFNP
ncbi:GlcG/HbpS family heme-binding protein [Acinetobacter guillouiae]|uniref:GlcG/HbpS family heme-binding protein n=1 Tax=Acinetobacter TaxID=469 RepID=UPI00334151E7